MRSYGNQGRGSAEEPGILQRHAQGCVGPLRGLVDPKVPLSAPTGVHLASTSPECVEVEFCEFFGFTEFSAPLCQAALRDGACESARRLLKTASETRLLRHRSASLRDLPSAIFLR